MKIYKRAQILAADIWACFEGKGYGEFNDISSVTMFADYRFVRKLSDIDRVPQGLVYMGVLKYSEDLMKVLEAGQIVESGDRLEVEIRGCSIWGVEVISRFMSLIE